MLDVLYMTVLEDSFYFELWLKIEGTLKIEGKLSFVDCLTRSEC